jgi:hypothetical protein
MGYTVTSSLGSNLDITEVCLERAKRNFDKMWLIVAVFPDAPKAFDTLWVKGLLYKLTILNFPSHKVTNSRIFSSSDQMHQPFDA